MATSVKHSGFKRLIDRDETLAILVNGAEVIAYQADSEGAYARQQIGTNVSGYESSTYVIDGYGVSLATGYDASGSNRNSAFDVLADTGSTDLTGDTYLGAIRGRSIIGTTQTNATINGVNGIVDVGTSVDFQGNLWGGQFVLDFYGTTTFGSGAACFGGGIGVAVWNEGTTTLGGGAVLAGIDLYQVSGAPTIGTGAIDTAINIRASAAAAVWKYGIYAKTASVGKFIQLGILSSTSQTGHHLSATYPVAVDFLMDDNNTTLTNEVYIGTRNRIMLFKDASGVSIFGTRGQLKMANGVDFTTGVFAANQGYLELVGDTTANAGAKVWGYDACIEVITSKTLTIASGAYCAGIHAELTGAGSVSNSGILAGVYVDSSAATAVWPYGMYVANATIGYYCNLSAIGATGRMAQFYGTSAAPNFGDGYGAVEVDLTTSGTIAGHTAALSAWVNIPSGTTGAGNIIAAQSNGIYEVNTVTMSACELIFGLRMSAVLGDTTGWATLAPFSINTSNQAITAIFDIASGPAIGYQAGTPSSSANGTIPFAVDNGGTILYIHTYPDRN